MSINNVDQIIIRDEENLSNGDIGNKINKNNVKIKNKRKSTDKEGEIIKGNILIFSFIHKIDLYQ